MYNLPTLIFLYISKYIVCKLCMVSLLLKFGFYFYFYGLVVFSCTCKWEDLGSFFAKGEFEPLINVKCQKSYNSCFKAVRRTRFLLGSLSSPTIDDRPELDCDDFLDAKWFPIVVDFITDFITLFPSAFMVLDSRRLNFVKITLFCGCGTSSKSSTMHQLCIHFKWRHNKIYFING